MKKGRAPDKRPARTEQAPEASGEFERAMAGVVPLPQDLPGRIRPRSPRPSRPLRPGPTPRAAPGDTEESASPPDDFVAAGVNRREIRKLKRDEYPAEQTLDLHGRSAAEARKDVARFIENGRHARLHCVCIVHGRGLNSAGGVSVLRHEVRRCLIATPAVLAYAVAPSSAGGPGAVYVLLRRGAGRG